MFSKFTVDFLMIAPKLRQVSLYSTVKNSTPAMQQEKVKSPRDWKMELANPRDSKKIIKFVETHFMKEEPLTKAMVPGQKPKIFKKLFGESLNQGLSVVAKEICGKQEIVGVCINDRSFKCTGSKIAKHAEEIKECNLRKLMETFAMIESGPKLNEKLCETEIFLLSILSVHEKHWGKGIGLELIRKSMQLGVEKNFKYAKMNCTNDNTRKIAEKLNMTNCWSAPYKDLLCRGSIQPRAFPEAPHTTAHVYYIDLKPSPPK